MSPPLDISTTVLCKSRHAEPVEARLRLEGETLTAEGDELAPSFDLPDVFDVRVGPPPTAAAAFFSGRTLAIGFDGEEGREVLFVADDSERLTTVADLLFRRLLHDQEVALRHPAEVGGRVTGESFDIGTLLVTTGRVGCADIDVPFNVALDSVVDFSRSERELLGEQRPIIEIQYVADGVAVSLELSITPPRKEHLLGRFLRREYDTIVRELGGLDIPRPALRALVRLYSLQGSAKPQSLFVDGSESKASLLRGLVGHDLVGIEDGRAHLTPRGWILVTEHAGHGDIDSDAGRSRASGD